MKKLLLLILALTLCLSLLTACQKENEKTPAETNDEEDTVDTLTTADILGFDKQNYNKEFNILLNDRPQNIVDFHAAEGSSDKLSTAVYERNLACEEYLGISINITTEPGQWNSGMPEKIYNLVLNGACEYDMVAMGLNTSIIGGHIDIYKNIMQMDYVEPTHSWWVQDLIDQVSINNQLYFLTGDACISTYKYIGCVFTNLAVADNYNLDVDFYELVKSGNWTMEQFITLFKKVGVDRNNDGDYIDEDEEYGWCNFNTGVRMMWSSADVNLIEAKADGTFAPRESLDDRIINFITTLKGAYDDPRSTYSDDTNAMVSAFSQDRVLFVTWYLYAAELYKASNVESPFAILPLPKYDNQQKDYISTNASAYNALFFPTTVKTPEMSAQVAEFMGWYGQHTVVPEYYDQTLKYRQNDVEANIEMLDLIRDKLRVTPNETYGVLDTKNGGRNALISMTQMTKANAGAETGFYTTPSSVWGTRYPNFKAWTESYVNKFFK